MSEILSDFGMDSWVKPIGINEALLRRLVHRIEIVEASLSRIEKALAHEQAKE